MKRANDTAVLLALAAACVVLLALATACGPTAVQSDLIEEEESRAPDVERPPEEEVTYECDDIPEGGTCRDGNAYLCDPRTGQIEVKHCSASGLVCDDASGEPRCVDDDGVQGNAESETQGPPSPYETGQTCGTTTYAGTCDGEVLRFCTRNDKLYVRDCRDIDATCGRSPTNGYYRCLPPTPPECSASGTTCEGNAVRSCSLGSNGWEVDLQSCGANAECTEAGGSARCEPVVPAGTEATCAALGEKGACIDASGRISSQQENRLAYCDGDGDLLVEDCSALGLRCVDPAGTGYVECNTP